MDCVKIWGPELVDIHRRWTLNREQGVCSIAAPCNRLQGAALDMLVSSPAHANDHNILERSEITKTELSQARE